ncbi:MULTISPECIES: DUF2209 domain-containing protein [unclassified Methanosarcina]|uniref:DUF2209 domain-containing protein n=1 Tax=unclassified Methanosarcina TaxID=2644672 RepID=UPI00062193EA|nr:MULTISPECIES: DUF2209 domain-containing protein [unclassified Methanosarcina]KKG11238.1 hypothetical protein EO92_18210 [Methanosarcina sp. 2.H.A.1B.4]KKH45937.1 hypothetical protein EO93_06725 [Methanosarcina sp. 1.H.A.2.2]
MWDIIAVDISGRHRIKGGYYMVCAAAALTVSADHIEKVKQVKILPFWLKRAPGLLDVVQLIEDTANQLSFEGTIVTEKGDMYNQPPWVPESMFSRAFKYQESIAERRAIELAHHISLSARNLLLKELNIEA